MLLNRNITQGLDYTTRDYEGFKQLMIQKLREKVPEYADYSDNDLGIIVIELLALGQDIQSYYIDKTANESLLHTAIERQNVMEHCANLGYTLRNATPSTFDQVFEITPSSEDTFIPQGTIINTQDNGFDEVLPFETFEDLIIPPNCTGTEKDAKDNYMYSVEVVQGRTIPEELLGTSNGMPNQEFRLWESPVIASQVEVLVNEGAGYQNWEYVTSFLQSKSTDKHFTLRLDGSSSATVVFGNGTLGAIPQSYEDGIIAKYRVGGGSKGNVVPRIITEMEQPLAFILRTYNPNKVKEEGQDIENIDLAKANAVRSLRTLDRAVTLQDFIDVGNTMLDFTLLVDAKEESDGRTVTIYLVSKYNDPLTTEEKEEALDLYQRVRMVGVTPKIQDATKIPVDLNITITTHPRDLTDYTKLLNDIVTEYFRIGNFNFRQKFSQSNLLKELLLLLPNTEDVEVMLSKALPILVQGNILVKGELNVEVTKI